MSDRSEHRRGQRPDDGTLVWVYRLGARRPEGPITVKELQTRIARGVVLPEDLLAAEAPSRWVRAGHHDGPFQDTQRGNPRPPRLPAWAAPGLRGLARRYLLRPLCLGLLAAVIAALVGWWLVPAEYTAAARVQTTVTRPAADAADASADVPDASAEDCRRAQVEMAKTSFVLKAALRDPSIAELPTLAGRRNPFGWLRANLEVGFPGDDDVLQIALSGSDPNELPNIVEAVAEAYVNALASPVQGDEVADAALDVLDREREELGGLYETAFRIGAEMDRLKTELDRGPWATVLGTETFVAPATTERAYTAACWLRIKRFRYKGSFIAGVDLEYRRATALLVKTPYLLREALRAGGISELPMLTRQDDPVGWLADNLEVTFPGDSDVLEIALTGEDATQLRKVVEAVRDAYVSNVADRERGPREHSLAVLESVDETIQAQIEDRSRRVRTLAKAFGAEGELLVAQEELIRLHGLASRIDGEIRRLRVVPPGVPRVTRLGTWAGEGEDKRQTATGWLRIGSARYAGGFAGDWAGALSEARRLSATLVKSPLVLLPSLRTPGVSELPMVARHQDPVAWLRDNLEATFPGNSDILQISLSGDDPAQLRKIVEAVEEAFLSKVVASCVEDHQERLAALQSEHDGLQPRIEQCKERIEKCNERITNARIAAGIDVELEKDCEELQRVEDSYLWLCADAERVRIAIEAMPPNTLLGTGSFVNAETGEKAHRAACWLWIGERSLAGLLGDSPTSLPDHPRARSSFITMPFILNTALQAPGISDLAIVAEQEDPIRWLRENLDVTVPGNVNILQIALTGDDPAQLCKIVEAVGNALLSELAKDKEAVETRLTNLESALNENRARAKELTEQIRTRSQSPGSDNRQVAEAATRKLQRERGNLASLKETASRIEQEIDQLRTALDEGAWPTALDAEQAAAVLIRAPAGTVACWSRMGQACLASLPRDAQTALVKLPLVLQAALRDPGVSKLPIITEQKDPLLWLTENIEVSFPGRGDVLQIAIRGDEAEQLNKVVEAVRDAYLSQIVARDKEDLQRRLTAQQSGLKRIQDQIQQCNERIKNLPQRSDTDAADTEARKGEQRPNAAAAESERERQEFEQLRATAFPAGGDADRPKTEPAAGPAPALLAAQTPVTADTEQKTRIVAWIALAAFALTFLLAAIANFALRRVRMRSPR